MRTPRLTKCKLALCYLVFMTRFFLPFQFALIALFFFAPLSVSAASKPFEISGWIPYWRTATGTADTLAHLDTFTEINPFGYTVKNDGTLYDAAKLSSYPVATTTPMGTTTTMAPSPWAPLIAEAKKRNIRVIPTVMWSNGAAMHAILSNGPKRRALEDAIAKVVKENDFDGIDIDFEGKWAETRPYFSTFLKGLYMRTGNKWVMCTIESRTPLDSRYWGTKVPKDAGVYANDFAAINKYCDRVRIMAYDQMSVDQKLAAQESGKLYAPLADIRWVEKVVNVAAKTISKKKIVIGVPTYGYEYDVTAYADGYAYDLLWSFNPGYALPIAAQYGIIPNRNAAGEISFSYIPSPSATTTVLSSGEATSAPMMHGEQAAATALLIASTTNSHSNFRLLWWSDAQAIASKVALAKKLGVRGVAIFKIDGGEDPAMWEVLK